MFVYSRFSNSMQWMRLGFILLGQVTLQRHIADHSPFLHVVTCCCLLICRGRCRCRSLRPIFVLLKSRKRDRCHWYKLFTCYCSSIENKSMWGWGFFPSFSKWFKFWKKKKKESMLGCNLGEWQNSHWTHLAGQQIISPKERKNMCDQLMPLKNIEITKLTLPFLC